jgi:hypothetical protein
MRGDSAWKKRVNHEARSSRFIARVTSPKRHFGRSNSLRTVSGELADRRGGVIKLLCPLRIKCLQRYAFGERPACAVNALCYRDAMAKVRRILPPAVKGTHVTLAEARAALRKLKLERQSRGKEKAVSRRTPTAKAG